MDAPIPDPVKTYRYHRCEDLHATWTTLAACIWPHAEVDGDGPFGAASCGARVISLYTDVDQAQDRTHGYDRDGCRPRCHHHHHVVDLTVAPRNAKPVKSTRPAVRRTPPPSALAAPKPKPPACGRPRTNGQPCQRPQGWGADTPGVGPCRDHGGSITERLARKERAVDQALAYASLLDGPRAEGVVLGVAGLAGGLLGSAVAEFLRDLGGEAS